MKKVVAGVDLASENVMEFLNFSISFGKQTGAEIVFVSVIDDWDVAAVGKISSMGYNVDGDHYVEDIEKNSILTLEKMIEDIDIEDEVETTIRIASGTPVKELLRIAVKENAEALIVGTKTHRDLEHAFESSVSLAIFKKSPLTVISYRPEKQAERLRKKIH